MLLSKKNLLAAAVAGAAIGPIVGSYETKEERQQAAFGLIGAGVLVATAYFGAKKGAKIGAQNTIVHVYLQRKDDSSKYQELRSLV